MPWMQQNGSVCKDKLGEDLFRRKLELEVSFCNNLRPPRFAFWVGWSGGKDKNCCILYKEMKKVFIQ